MQITSYNHSCLKIEIKNTSILLDPGNFSTGWETLTNVDILGITHIHADHLDIEKFPQFIKNNPNLKIISNKEVLKYLETELELNDKIELIEFKDGSVVENSDCKIEGFGIMHAVILKETPNILNIGFIIIDKSTGKNIFQPGDSLNIPESNIDFLAIPIMAPWSKIQETLDFYNAISAEIAFPIHDGLLLDNAKEIFFDRISEFGTKSTKFIILENNVKTEII